MNIDKLTKELTDASTEKAANELDRMIELHKAAAKIQKEAVKRYLHAMATTPGKVPSYIAGSVEANQVTAWVQNEQQVVALEQLKKELE